MGIENIATGYKPEFALGALYHGFNAGSADNASQLANLIQEQALQKSRIGDPLDLIKQFYEAQLANAKSQSPDYIPMQLSGQIGQMQTQEAAGKTAQALQPFKQKAEQAQLENAQAKDTLFGNMYRGMVKQHDQSLDPNVREAAAQGASILAGSLAENDPKYIQQKGLLGMKGEQNLDLEEMRQAGRIRIASLKPDAIRGDKTAQEALVKELQRMRATGEISPAEYAAELTELQNAILAAKVQPGQELDPNNPALKGLFKPKPAQQGYTAPVANGTQSVTPVPASLQSQVEASGVAYEPSKYDYRVVEGKVQRKLKGN